MPKPPKSPLDKPSSGHPRRPSHTTKSTSSEKLSKPSSSTSSRHGVRVAGHGPNLLALPAMTALAPSASAPKSSRAPVGIENSVVDPESDTVKTVTSEANEMRGGADETGKEATTSRAGASLSRTIATPDGSAMSPQDFETLRQATNAAQLRRIQDEKDRMTALQGMSARTQSQTSLRSRISPIHEEVAPSPTLEDAFASPFPTGMETASTESNRTIRGEMTPAILPVRTPSYPFPSMKTPRQLSFQGHRPFTSLSPTVAPNNFSATVYDGPLERLTSGSTTPASTMTFQPPGTHVSRDDSTTSSPNLYDLSLMLSSEPGIDAWWTTVVRIMSEVFKADRVTLAVPADSTDIENVPWGQKATWNAQVEDHLSVTYLPRGSSLVPSSGGTNDTSASDETDDISFSNIPLDRVRPGLQSRHSYTAYEDTKRVSPSDNGKLSATRQPPLPRSKSYVTARPEQTTRSSHSKHTGLSLESLQEHQAYEEAKEDDWQEDVLRSSDKLGMVFPVLQALDYEADPLIDPGGVISVLERGKLIALTRDYPYLENPTDDTSSGSKASQRSDRSKDDSSGKAKRLRPEMSSHMSSFLSSSKGSRRSSRSARSQASERNKGLSSNMDDAEDETQAVYQRYEEYEQAPPSPWSQSPAPSPAPRADPSENPFFVNATVDEESFNPAGQPQDYSKLPPIEAIGIDRSCTVLHIPLIHPLLSKPVHAFRLNKAALESKSGMKNKEKLAQKGTETSHAGQRLEPEKERLTPIAILSVISPINPYQSKLRHVLQNLAPHLATSFSLCRHYSNLESEITGLSRKRPNVSGFGGVNTGSRLAKEKLSHALYHQTSSSVEGSTFDTNTSPSDYSAIPRSVGPASPGTPGFERTSNAGDKYAREAISPPYGTGDGYFTARIRPGFGKTETGSSANISVRRDLKDPSVAEPLPTQRNMYDEKNKDPSESKVDKPDITIASPSPAQTSKQVRIDPRSRDLALDTSGAREISPSRYHGSDSNLSPRRAALRSASSQGHFKHEHKQHTQLHSYGADFSATFQSLPNTTAGSVKLETAPAAQIRPSAVPGRTEMPPPSDRLKTLMLDTLPAHLFVALPQTGEIVWVNNRYLTYRGQTITDLFLHPWSSIHHDELDGYVKAWTHALRTGEQFSMQVRIRRFDGKYRWFYTRAVGGRDTRGVIVQWYGSYMDIHDQHIAEVKAARQEEIEASEAKHRLLANLIPQIIFAATEEEGVTFANEQWLSYTGQKFDEALGIGFVDFVHPEDIAKCRIPTERDTSSSSAAQLQARRTKLTRVESEASSGGHSSSTSTLSAASEAPTEATVKGTAHALSRHNSSSSGSLYDLASADLSELARNGVIKVTTDVNGRLSYTTEVRLKAKSGEYRWHLVRCVEIDNINFGSGASSWFGACTDINDHKLLETKLKEAMDSKSKFLSNMSHEIRTPLIGISGMVAFLQDTVLNEEQTDYTNTIQSSANNLLMIINDILDLSKVDAGMMKLSHDWFHTRSLIEEVNELVSTMAISKRLELNYVVDEDVPSMVKGDRFRIRQVLLNIIGNAIKFTAKGEVFSHCEVVHDVKTSPNEIMLKYSVVDTGAGFTKEEGDMIFKPFSQIDGSSTRQHGGSGLGLVISRQLVELHGGTMHGSAVPGKGSTFTFSAKFGLPTTEDQPDPPHTPLPGPVSTRSTRSSVPPEVSARAYKSAGGNPILTHRHVASPGPISPSHDLDSPAIASSASSDPSVRSARTHLTERSSASSINMGFSHFSEAAKASGPDLAKMKLAIPDKSSPELTPRARPSKAASIESRGSSSSAGSDLQHFRPPLYSILIICPQLHSREATTKHIEMTVPKDVPHQITALASVDDARKLISGDDPVIFTHIVMNLSDAEEIIKLMDQIFGSISLPRTTIVILSDPVQRQAVMRLASDYDYDQLAKDNRVNFVYKPVKPSRFAVIFDPDKERDLSFDRNRSTAQQHVATQKQNYLDAEKRLGNKGIKVLLVEDNLVNQKVLLKYLSKVGIAVEIASDGVECTDKIFAKPHDFYSIVLCDLHMPRKDGYQTCRDIREWEMKHKYPRMPIIALSANVMADVLEKSVGAGFDSYVTKPVDFKELSTSMSNLLDPEGR